MAPSSSEAQRTLMGPPWVSSSTVFHVRSQKTEPSLDGATLMTHAKFEVIAKLRMCTRGGRFHGDHEVLERAPVPVVAAAALVVRERGERDNEDLVGAARGARTLDEARRALRKWSYL